MALEALIMDYGGVLSDQDEPPEMGASLSDVVRHVRKEGIRTALLSNAGVGAYPESLRTLFDSLVLSGEVGLSKPDAAVYRLTAQRLGVATSQCVFVDDEWSYVSGAVEVGMVGVHHRSVSSTVDELRILFGC